MKKEQDFEALKVLAQLTAGITVETAGVGKAVQFEEDECQEHGQESRERNCQ